MTRIVALAVDDVFTDLPPLLRLGTKPLRMEPPIDRLLHQLTVDAATRGSRWLFPSHSGHLSAGHLADRLARVGIGNRLSARNASWAALVADTPPIVLAEKLGISVSGAERWSEAAGGARSVYAGMRVVSPSAQQRQPETDSASFRGDRGHEDRHSPQR
jgi:hypothetical protein